MDAQLQNALETAKRATVVVASRAPEHEGARAALRTALALRTLASTVDALVRTFTEATVRRDPAVPSSAENARLIRGRLEQTLERTRIDEVRVGSDVDPLIAALFVAGLVDEAADVKAARDAFMASITMLRALTDEMIDVLILREAELDSDNGAPPVSLADVLAGLDRVA